MGSRGQVVWVSIYQTELILEHVTINIDTQMGTKKISILEPVAEIADIQIYVYFLNSKQ